MNQGQDSPIEQELECTICYSILYRPVSLPCGHTFCRDCINQFLESKPQCPLCRTPTFLSGEQLFENISLKSMIERKYPDKMFAREQQESKEKLARQKEAKEIKDQSQINYKPKEFVNIFALYAKSYEQYFPGIISNIVAKFDGPKELFSEICQNGNFILINPQKSQNEMSFLVKCIKINNSESKTGYLSMSIQILSRIKLRKITNFPIEKPELNQKYQLSNEFLLHACSGEEYIDFFQQDEDLDSLKQLIHPIQDFWNQKLQEANSYQLISKIQNKISNNQMFYLLSMKDQANTFEIISEISLIFAGLLMSTNEEQKQMIETNRLTERLIILNSVTQRLQPINNFSQIYNIDIPASSLNSLRNAVLLIFGIVLLLIANKFGYLKRFK